MGQFKIDMPLADSPLKLNLAAVLLDSLRVYRKTWGKMLAIVALTAAVIIVVGALTLLPVIGYSATPNAIDPASIAYTLTPGEWAIGAVALITVLLLISYAGAVTVQLAYTPRPGASMEEALSISQAFARIKAAPMQLFWLQWIVTVLSSQFSAFAAPLLWIFVGPTIPLAVIEGLGPSAAIDRMWNLSRGSRIRILIWEVGLYSLLPVVLFAISRYVIRPGGPLDSADRPTAIRIPIIFVSISLAVAAAQFAFVGLTCAYARLSAADQTAMHAAAPEGVS
jgi:hypothetical protein